MPENSSFQGAATGARNRPKGSAKASNILTIVDSALYRATYDAILSYKPNPIKYPKVEEVTKGKNYYSSNNKWPSDFLRGWASLTGTVLREYKREPFKAILFPATQLILCAMNPRFGEGQLWNPLHILFLMGAPFIAGNLSIYLDQLIMGGHSRNVERDERLGRTPFHKHLGIGLNIESLTGGGVVAAQEEKNIYTTEKKYPDVRLRTDIDLKALFINKKNLNDDGTAETPLYHQVDKSMVVKSDKEKLFMARLQSFDKTPLMTEGGKTIEDDTGGVYKDILGRDLIDLVIYDYKTNTTVAFPAALKTFSETLAPRWQLENFIGRVDPVPSYLSTTRTFNLGLEFFAASKEEFRTMWRKLNWLSSLVYPGFDTAGIKNRDPIIRVKLGDVLNDYNDRGLLSVITSLTYDYKGSATWETDPETGIGPQNVIVTFSITVFHETEPPKDIEDDKKGIKKIYLHTVSYENGMKGFRKLGMLPIRTAQIKDTDLSTVDTDNDELQEADTGVKEEKPNINPE